eukprot:COSAG04_NODE_10915_length_744_cov_0.888372_1_plen_65_part_00
MYVIGIQAGEMTEAALSAGLRVRLPCTQKLFTAWQLVARIHGPIRVGLFESSAQLLRAKMTMIV